MVHYALGTFQWQFHFSSVGWYQRIYKFVALIGTDLDRSIILKVNDIYAFPFIFWKLTTFAVLTTSRANLTFFKLYHCWRCLRFPCFHLNLDSSLAPCWKSRSLLFWALTPRYTTYPLLYKWSYYNPTEVIRTVLQNSFFFSCHFYTLST